MQGEVKKGLVLWEVWQGVCQLAAMLRCRQSEGAGAATGPSTNHTSSSGSLSGKAVLG